MAGKAKSIYLSVIPLGQLQSVFKRVFFNAKDYNEYVNSDEFKANWPTSQYQILKEVYWHVLGHSIDQREYTHAQCDLCWAIWQRWTLSKVCNCISRADINVQINLCTIPKTRATSQEAVMNLVALSFWLLNPVTHNLEWIEQARYSTPDACAYEVRTAQSQGTVPLYVTWRCIYVQNR